MEGGGRGGDEGRGGHRRNYIIPSHPSSHANNDDKRHKDNAVYLDVALDKDGGGWGRRKGGGKVEGEREERGRVRGTLLLTLEDMREVSNAV